MHNPRKGENIERESRIIANLKHIETFVEVARSLSFADAARSLGIPASTVTTRVKNLESNLGVRLLERTTRNVALTSEGQIFFAKSQNALYELSEAHRLVGAAQSSSGLVRLSIPVAFPFGTITQIVSRFQSSHPDILFDIAVEDRMISFVRDGVDLALRGGRPGDENLIAFHLRDTEVVFVAPPGRLDDEQLPILHPIRQNTTPLSAARISTRSLGLAHEFILRGMARGYLPLEICEGDLLAGYLTKGSGPRYAHPALPLYLVYHEKRHMPQRVMLFKNFIITELKT